jgi:thiol-disulfide isomerase/thioredoxin
MSKQPGRRPANKNRPQARKGRTAVAAKTARKGTDRTAWIIAVVVIAVGASLVFVFAKGSKTSSSDPIKGRKPAPASLVKKVTTIPASVTNQVGAGTVTGLPTKLPGPPLLTASGKPRIIYMGAEYCPYCATERWAMVNALSRFGTFSNLKITSSAAVTTEGSPEVFPNTPTFSFYGATYKSDYIQFEPVEQQNNSYGQLETPTAEQNDLLNKYDAPPYSDTAGAIPFIDFANQYVSTGATYDAGVLANNTHAQIADAMNDPTTAIAKGSLGAANVLTATICKTTDNKPANTCNEGAIQAIQSQLPTTVPAPAK